MCPEGKIVNPKTNRCVSKNGAIGKKLQECPDGKILNPKSNRCVSKTGVIGRRLTTTTFNCNTPGLNQISATCWYNSIFNAFIMSQRLNAYMMDKYAKLSQVQKDKIAKMNFDPDKCEMEIKLHYFYKYFLRYSSQRQAGQHVDIRILRADVPFKMINLMSIRKTPNWNKNVGYMPQIAIAKLARHLFTPAEFILSEYPDISISAKKAKFICFNDKVRQSSVDWDMLRKKYNQFDIECASLGIIYKDKYGNIYAHAILGFVCNNKKYVFDSNNTYVEEVNWTNSDEFEQFAEQKYKNVESTYFYYILLMRN